MTFGMSINDRLVSYVCMRQMFMKAAKLYASKEILLSSLGLLAAKCPAFMNDRLSVRIFASILIRISCTGTYDK
jgi:hypothetical protein